MKILIHSHLFPYLHKPSFGLFVFHGATALAKLGHIVIVVAPVPYVPPWILPTCKWHEYKSIPYKRIENGLIIYHPRFISIPRRKFFYLRGEIMFYSAYFFYIKLFKRYKFNIIHSHTAIPDGVVGHILSKKYKIPYGITIHGADLYESIPETVKNLNKIKKTIKEAAFTALVSKRLKCMLYKYKIVPNNRIVKIVYNGINKWEIDSKVEENVRKTKIKILTVANAIERKGIQDILLVLAQLRKKYKNMEFYLIGDGPLLQNYKQLSRDLEINDFTYFLGEMNNEDVLHYMKNCHIFLLPSWDEAFGVVYIEAMSQGMITVGSEGEGISEIIKDGWNGFLVKPRNINSIKVKLDYIICHLKEMYKVRVNAYQTSLKFTWDNNAREYLNLYRVAYD